MKTPRPDRSAVDPTRYSRLPAGIWALGMVSMLMDISSELVHSLLPLYLTSVMGASMLTVGAIEGMAEAAAAVSRVFSGTISDYLGRRKLIAVIGYGLSAATKPIFPLAGTVSWIFAARFIDRLGKGIRGAPRDALVADLVTAELRGAAYGLRQALDSVGAFIGPALALAFMLWLGSDIRAVLWLAIWPAWFAVLLLVIAVREKRPTVDSPRSAPRLSMAQVSRLPRRFWQVVALGGVFTLARFSEAFLILRIRDVGLAAAYVPAVLIVMNLVYAVFAYPAGAVADRLSARTLLLYGLGVLIIADMVLALAISPAVAFAGAAFWGLHMALTQGLLAKLVADNAPVALRGTAFGIFNLVCGVAVLLASVIAGACWSAFGPSATFFAGAVFAAMAATGLHLSRNRPRRAG